MMTKEFRLMDSVLRIYHMESVRVAAYSSSNYTPFVVNSERG